MWAGDRMLTKVSDFFIFDNVSWNFYPDLQENQLLYCQS